MREFMREQWKDPVYREKMSARLRAQAHRAVAARDKGFRAPDRKSPEGRIYDKLCRVLGPRAAREALGIGQ